MQSFFAILISSALFSLGLSIADKAKEQGFWLGTSVDNTSQSFRDFFK
jgi:hypothetical protein